MRSPQAQAKVTAKTLPTALMPTASYNPQKITSKPLHTSNEATNDKFLLPKLSIFDLNSTSTDSQQDLLVESEIGVGGLGQVDAATQTCFGRKVAIKRVRHDRGCSTAEMQLLKEAEIMGQLEHSAIPPAHIVGLDDSGHTTLVMKLIEGKSWLDVMRNDRTKLNKNELPHWYLNKHLLFLLRIGEALHFAHQKSIIHRDVKPENVVIGDYGEVYLIDWGIAEELDEGNTFWGDSFAGTPCYSPPETILPKPKWSIQSDVYLMGATMYQIITGDPPHCGENVQDVFEHILKTPTPVPNGEVPIQLASIFKKAMVAEPRDRYSSVRSMLEDIRSFQAHGKTRRDELNVGIQVILIEQIASQKKAYDELLSDYKKLQDKSGDDTK